jgi:hypothetical protein
MPLDKYLIYLLAISQFPFGSFYAWKVKPIDAFPILLFIFFIQ